jgi:hypothetical protein
VLNVFVGETAALAVAAVVYFPRCASMLQAFKKGHAAKSDQKRRHTNLNICAHLGKYITAATAKAAVSPTKTFNT